MTATPPIAAATVDARGLKCPLPLLKAKLALNSLAAGECVRVLASDPGFARDVAAFAAMAGHTLYPGPGGDDHIECTLEKVGGGNSCTKS